MAQKRHLEFVKNVSGGITQEANDYYDDLSGANGQCKDEYAKYVNNYISVASKEQKICWYVKGCFSVQT